MTERSSVGACGNNNLPSAATIQINSKKKNKKKSKAEIRSKNKVQLSAESEKNKKEKVKTRKAIHRKHRLLLKSKKNDLEKAK